MPPVEGCLDSGAERVVVISMLHAFSDEMEAARVRVADGGDPSEEKFWGIQGPGITGRAEWLSDHALCSFRYLRGPLTGEILDIAVTDATQLLYSAKPPTWVEEH